MSNKSCVCNNTSLPYRPVVIVHGLMTGDVSTMQHLATNITKIHPGTKTYVINRFCGLASLEPLWRQTKLLADDLLYICSLHPEGVHVIGYSQGGLIVRGMLEMCGNEHNVKTFVSLSSPQGGQYGAECFTKMFPALTTRTAYELFYSRLGQRALSVANYWYDPRHRDLYLKYSVYLAVIDNLKPEESNIGHLLKIKDGDKNKINDSILNTTNLFYTSSDDTIIVQSNEDETKIIETHVSVAIAAVTTATIKVAEGHDDDNSTQERFTSAATIDSIMTDTLVNNVNLSYLEDDYPNAKSNTRKIGLARLQRMVLIGGPDDGVISPWQSSQFAVLDSTGGLIQLRNRQQDDVFSNNDPIGLRQLDMTGRLIEYTVPGVHHHEWHHNEKVLNECIIYWLD
ncbi:Palmitoyl protein thioesterase,Alpha/Beta hydrolase fold [Cinara cedri]|uniref:palmitoyl-CoA hydrolase n=1 Tax=Cinara cedri TaxID=506608 RepID=A0A5E4M5P5_9HEMI|nr:Palmitoyl protein thioesterase,Alpha/Beta hydrolase fold [Cinara cedri]